MDNTKKKKIEFELSIIIPVFNEVVIIPILAESLFATYKNLPKKTEIIFIDDGSSDGSAEKIKKTKWPCPVKLIEFSRNFGHQSALLAGLQNSNGKAIVTMDADLQHPPTLIPKLFEYYKNGYDVVLTQRIDKAEHVSFKKRITSKLFYSIINILSDINLPENASDFRLLSKNALQALLSMPEQRKFLRGMVNWIGYKTILVPFEVEKRAAGSSKYSALKMFKLAFNGITSFSVVPLYFSGLFSICLFSLATLYALYVLYAYFIAKVTVSGWASLLLINLIIGGFLSLFLGLIGFYLAAIYEEVKQRPPFIIKDQCEL